MPADGFGADVTQRLGANDPRLGDPVWMRRMYAQHGDMWIALETGAARETVRRRREMLGIRSARSGRRRIVTALPTVEHVDDLTEVESEFIRRIRDQRSKTPPTETVIAERLREEMAARDRDPFAFDSALLDAAVVRVLLVEHRRKLRRAA